jgi:hypothetical protein
MKLDGSDLALEDEPQRGWGSSSEARELDPRPPGCDPSCLRFEFVHRRQTTFDALDTGTGEISRRRLDATG